MTPELSMSVTRARLVGVLALVGAFAAGGITVWAFAREPKEGLRVSITATDQMPAEIERLGLDTAQRSRIQHVLQQGRDRVLRVVDTFDAPMRAAVDSTEREIREVLSPTQRAALDSWRLERGPPLKRVRVVRP